MKILENKKCFVLFYMSGFFAGILYANFVSKDYVAGMGIFNEFFLDQYVQMEIDLGEFLWYAAYIRLFPVMVLAAVGCTRFRKGAALTYVVWTGYSCGMILTTAVMKMGVKGIILCLISLTPQFLCYAAGYIMLLWHLFCYPRTRWDLSKTICFALFMLMGILLECYVNPIIVKMFLRTL